MLHVDKIVNRVFNSNTYVLRAEGSRDVWLVDCGDTARVLELLKPEEKVVGVLLTHGHSDHIYGLNELTAAFPEVKIYTTEFGLQELQSSKLNFSRYHEEYEAFVVEKVENVCVLAASTSLSINSIATLDVCGEECKVYATPGHDPSCLCYVVGGYLFTGDAYIPGVKVVTNFPKSNKQQAAESLERILTLAEGLGSTGLDNLTNRKPLTIMPGHTIIS